MSAPVQPVVLPLSEIEPLVDPLELIEVIERGFVLYSQGRVTVPPVGFLNFDDPPGDVHIKYGYVPGDDVYVLKVASGFYHNPSLGLPAGDGLILVFSQTTGALELVLLDRCWLTDMRTAAAGAVAAKHLAPDSVECIGIVGTGVQARMQLEMLRHVVDCSRCLVWGRDSAKAAVMVEEMRADDGIQEWGLEVIVAAALENLVPQCDLIVTATSARAPLFDADLVQLGTHVTAMGSDDHGKQELDAALLRRADVVVADSRSQCVDHGECHYAVQGGLIEEDQIVELGQVIDHSAPGRAGDHQITVADLTGVAIQDIQIAKIVREALGLQRAVV
ncbi:MAG: ornithine cyclodeaminase family protein [Gemmatimonadetes bacterium]|nr:ornithine cyclodeaminase family protein [Gemmatimonadota bacterium]NNF14758.1 ornithine cyclodeaminase family protein [Gemmatimonadota bacterium]